jgi:DNA-binding CsgD family transcriptional regulator
MLNDAGARSFAGSAELYGNVLHCTRFEQLCGSVLSPVSTALNASSSVFLQFINMPPRRDCMHRESYVGNAPESVDAYRAGYYEMDPLIAGGLRLMRSKDAELGAMVTLLSGLPGWREASYYTRFLRQFDIGHVLGILVPVRTVNRSELMCLGFHRTHEAEGFSDREVRMLRDLTPLLQTVLTNLAFRDAMHLSEQVERAMSDNSFGIGFVVLDEDLMVCHANQSGLSQLGLYRAPGASADHRQGVFGELRERLLHAPFADGHRETFTLGIPACESNAMSAINVDVRAFKSFDGHQNYLLVTGPADERRILQESFRRAGLSDREAEVARLVCAGQSNAQIGRELGITFRTVENHLRSAYQKVGVHSRTQLVSRLLHLQ